MVAAGTLTSSYNLTVGQVSCACQIEFRLTGGSKFHVSRNVINVGPGQIIATMDLCL